MDELDREWARELALHKKVLEKRIKNVANRKIVTVISAWIDVVKKTYFKMKTKIGIDSPEFVCFVTKQKFRIKCEEIGKKRKNGGFFRDTKENMKYRACMRNIEKFHSRCYDKAVRKSGKAT